MPKLRGKESLDDMKWHGVEEPQTDEDKRKALDALNKAMERHERQLQNQPKYDKKHHGGEDY